MRSNSKEKRGQRRNRLSTGAGLCRWCDSSFSPFFGETVCPACRKLLTGANLTDEEIFGAQSRAANAPE